jgi:tetratricopeptide (TPR) repeat protein
MRRYARECGTAAEYSDERSAGENRLLSFYLHTAINADQMIFPSRPDHSSTPVAGGVTPLRFATDELAMSWCVRERANLISLIHYAEARGLHAYSMRLPATAGEILQRLGYYDDVLGALNVAIRSARSMSDLAVEADAVSNLGFVHVRLRDFTSAESCLRVAGELHGRIGNRVGSAMVLHYLARLRVEQGQLRQGIELNMAALANLRGEGAEGLEIIVRYRLGEAHRRAHDLDTAATHCRDGLWLAEKIGDERGQARCLTELGAICFEHGDLAMAKGYCARGLAVHQRLRDPDQVGKTYNVLSAVHHAQGDLTEAERCARQATVACRHARNSTGELTAHHTLGQLLHTRGQLQEATEAWAKALAIAEDLDDPLTSTLRRQLVETGRTHLNETDTRTEPLIWRRPSVGPE